MKKIALLVLLLTIGFDSQASIPENMPEAVYDGIVQTVITDTGYFDNIKVEKAITQWLLAQPLPATDGDLIDSGSCTNCAADDSDADSRFKQPRNVKVKAKLQPNGKFPSVLKIKWKKPKKLPSAIRNDYELSHYNVYISKDDASYELLEVTPKYKRNGKLKKIQKIRFKDRSTGNYQVQVRAIYIPTATAKSAQTKGATSEKGSNYTVAISFITHLKEVTVRQLQGAARNCLLSNGFVDTTLLLDIITPVDCSNQNLVNYDIKALAKLSNIRSLNISTNPAVNSVSILNNLAYLEYLDLSNNPTLTLPDFSTFEELKTLYLNNMGLTTVPDLSLNDALETLGLNDNPIVSGFELLPSLIVLEIKGGDIKTYCTSNPEPAG